MSQKKHRLLITGASSDLLSRLITLVDPEKYTIRAVSRDSRNRSESRHEWLIGDISDADFVHKAMKGIDAVIHGAAVTHGSKREYIEVNVRGTETMVDEAVQAEVKRFVFISSRAAGERSGAYGYSKFTAEEYVKRNVENWLIIRPAELFGGKNTEGINLFVRQVASRSIVMCPTGLTSPLRPLHIDDAAQLIFTSIFHNKLEKSIVYINGDTDFSLMSLAKSVSSITGRKPMILPVPAWLLIPLGLLLEKLPLNFGFAPDQVTRLYSKKGYDPEIKHRFKSIQESVQDILKQAEPR